MNNCIFCDADFQRNNKYWDNEYFYAIFDHYPVSPGHSLLIPKIHISNLHDLKSDAWASLQIAIDEAIRVIGSTELTDIYKKFMTDEATPESIWFVNQAFKNPNINKKPDAYNYGVNDGEAAGRTVPHLHIHIIPRHIGDMADPRGGVRYVIPEMGNYKVKR